MLRQALRVLLNQQAHLDIVGEVGTGEETVHAAMRLQPDLILLDLILPDSQPSTLCPEIRRVSPQSRILILSGVEDAAQVYQAVDAGINGYALKNMSSAELLEAITEVASGGSYLHPSITRLVLHRAAHSGPDEGRPSTPLTEGLSANALTKRQKQVLMLMASTATNREIAERLVVSEETVRTHVKNILKKLDTSTRTQAVVEAVRLGIISV